MVDELAGGRWHLLTMDDATHILGADAERGNLRRLWAPYWRYARPKVAPAWFALMDFTRAMRTLLGLRGKPRGAGVKKSHGEAASGPQVPGSTT